MALVTPPDWDRPISVFWRRPGLNLEGGTDISLRSITPHLVRSRLKVFANVLVDQRQSLAIHNVTGKCQARRARGKMHCGSIHFGFCKAVEETRRDDVRSRIERLETERIGKPQAIQSSNESLDEGSKEPQTVKSYDSSLPGSSPQKSTLFIPVIRKAPEKHVSVKVEVGIMYMHAQCIPRGD